MTLTYRPFYINGQWVDSLSGERYAVTNPATEESIAEMAIGTRADVKRAIDAAAAALPAWMKTTAYERARIRSAVFFKMRARS